MKVIDAEKSDFYETAARYLEKDEIIITETDTIPGFLCRSNKKNFFKLSKIKNRAATKPFLVVIPNLEELYSLEAKETLDKHVIEFLRRIWPGKVTVVLRSNRTARSFFPFDSETIAIRIPEEGRLRKLLEQVGPCFSTSVNQASAKPITDLSEKSISEIRSLFSDDVALIIKNKQHKIDNGERLYKNLRLGKPSTIVDISFETSTAPLIIREGAVKIEELEQIYGEKFRKRK